MAEENRDQVPGPETPGTPAAGAAGTGPGVSEGIQTQAGTPGAYGYGTAGGKADAGQGSGGTPGNWFNRHKTLTGVIAGLLLAALLGGMFAIGYAVGKPDRKPRVEIELPERPRLRALPREGARMRERVEERLEELEDYIQELREMVASELGMTVDELEDELKDGKSVADLALEKGMSTEALVDSLASRIQEMVDRLVSEGKISEARGEWLKDRSDAFASILVHGGYRLLFLRRAV